MKKEVFSVRVKAALILSLVIYLSTVLTLGFVSDSSIYLVFVGTIPVLIYLIIFFMFFDNKKFSIWVAWTGPLVLNLIFFSIWKSGSVKLISLMEGPTLTVLNLLISYLVNIFFFFVLDAESKRLILYQNKEAGLDNRLNEEQMRYQSEIRFLKQQVEHYHRQLTITNHNFNVKLRNIEDKCKAINFVIGRVYSNKRGGSPEIRDSIRIHKELYNSFSEITADFKAHDSLKLIGLLERIHKALIILEKKEREIIDVDNNPQIPLIRDLGGNDRILDVLGKNDKDPILEYHAEAKEVCEKIMEFVRKRESRTK